MSRVAETLVRTQRELDNAPEDELDRGIDTLCGLHYSSHAHLLAFIAAKDARDPDSRATVVGLSAKMGITIGLARRWLETARLLRDLPHLSELYGSGSLSYEKLEAVARVATPATDESLAEAAPLMSTGAIRKLAAKLDAVKDPAPALLLPLGPGRGVQDLGTAARRCRRHRRQGDRARDGCDAGDAGGGTTSYAQKAADALVSIASADLAEDGDADRATVVVHTDLSVLTDGEGVAESEFGTILHPDVVRRLACDCRMEIVAHHSDGTPLGYGRTRRTASPWLMGLEASEG